MLIMHRIHTRIIVKYLFIFIAFFELSLNCIPLDAAEITVTGNAVAVSQSPISLLILNGYIHTEIIVLVDKPHNMASQFIRIVLSVPVAQYDKWETSLSSLHRFRINRKQSLDRPLDKSYPLEELPSKEVSDVLPAWRLLKGYENIKLPFNVILMTFESIDWPDVGVV